MFLLRAVRASVLAAVVASPAMAQGVGDLLPRQSLAKQAITELPAGDVASLRLIVKFDDDVRARSREGGQRVIAQSNRDVTPLRQIMNQFGVRIVPAINHAEEQLAELQASAALHSGKGQPDLAGMMYVTGAQDGESLLAVAQALNALEFVEFVSFEVPLFPTAVDPMQLGAIQTNQLDAREAGDELVQRTNNTLQLRKSIVASLDVPALLGAGLDLQVPLMAGLPVTLRLDPHSVRAADFQMLEALPNGGMAPIDPGPEGTLRGDIPEIPGAIVAGALVGDGLLAGIRLPDGTMWFIEPIVGVVEGAALGDHVIYAQADTLDNQGFCGTGLEHQVQLGPAFNQDAAQGGAVAGGLIFAEIALDLDFEYYQAFDSDAFAAGQRAAAVIAVLNVQYEGEVGISHMITTVVVRTSQGANPYTTNDPGGLLTEFTDEWNANNAAIRRDVAHLFTGREIVGGVIGVAWIGGVCQDVTGLGYSFAQLFGAFGCQTDLSAHELGHNWNAFHCDCTGNTMNPFITCANTFEPTVTIPSITVWRDIMVGQGCLGMAAPAGCGGFGAGDCGTASANPYCNDVICCGAVCAADPACCETAWDEMCVAAAGDLCGGCGSPGAGSCLEANLTPGCSNQACCDAVCAIDPACCAVWDESCAIQSLFISDCAVDVLGDTPDLTLFQAYRTVSATPGFSMLTEAVLGPGAVYNGEGFDLDGLWDLGADLAGALGGVENLTRGKTIKVAVLETACYAQHEDLDVIVEPGQTMYLNEQITSPSHGTAVLGIMAAMDNGFGMTGIASDAESYFFPSFSLEQGGRFLSALTSAAITLGPGDVLNMSLGPDNNNVSGDCSIGVLTSAPATWILVRLMSDRGSAVFISAGNECCSLEGTPEAGGDSGATIVSAVDPGFPFCRRAFSNHSDGGAFPHISAWGEVVATLGAGNLFGPANDPNRQYRVDFNGTSAAAPMAAGIAACLQGLAKELYGIPLMPEQIRNSMQAGWCQCLTCNPDDLFGSEDGMECGGDVEEDEDPNIIGLTTEVMLAADNVLTNGWFDGSPLVDDIEILRGTLVYGNRFSIKASENNRFQIKSQYTEPTDNQHLGITYLGYGHMTDVKITAHADIPAVAAIGVVVEGNSTGGILDTGTLTGNSLMFVELFDWNSNRWRIVAFDNLFIADPLLIPVYPVPTAWLYVDDNDRIELRLWTLTLGGLFGGGFGGAPDGTYVVSYDWIDIIVSANGDIFLPP